MLNYLQAKMSSTSTKSSKSSKSPSLSPSVSRSTSSRSESPRSHSKSPTPDSNIEPSSTKHRLSPSPGPQLSSLSLQHVSSSSSSSSHHTSPRGSPKHSLSPVGSDRKSSTPESGYRKTNGHDPPVVNHRGKKSAYVSDSEEDDRLVNGKLLDYIVLSTIGTGTFGRVVIARHKKSHEYYALKVLMISEVIRLKQTEHVKNEKEILLSVKHPFIVNMLWSDHDDKFLYMLLEYVPGGELFSYLRSAGYFENSKANFYASEIVCALEYLHGQSIAYRDLKPENLLLDKLGHLKITDFGFAKRLQDRTWTLCGTPEYLAPEIIQSRGHNKAVDWWALGILIFEMLNGYPPFFDENPFGIYQKILVGKVDFPKNQDPVAKDLIKKLLVQDRTRRLGNMKSGAEDVKRHRWFKHISWPDVFDRKLQVLCDLMRYRELVIKQPPIVPKLAHDGDTKNFEDYPEADFSKAVIMPQQHLDLFKDF